MLGLVLEGGGAKGSFHAGVVKALYEYGYQFDGVMGTSIGAVNGALIAQGDFDACYKMWKTVKPSTILDLEDDKVENFVHRKWDKETVKYMFGFMVDFVKQRGISMEKASAYLATLVDEKKLRASPIDFGVVAVSITDKWKPVEIFKEEMEAGTLLQYVLASAYFPAFKSELLNGKRYMDGGIYDNLPVNPLIRRGYDHVIAVRTMSNMPHKKVIDRSVKVDYIQPSEDLGNTITFTRARIDHNLTMGYYDALRYIKGLKGNQYYVRPLEEAAFLAQMERKFSAAVYRKLAEILGIEFAGKRETVLAVAAAINAELKKTFTVYEAYIALTELYASAYGIYRFRETSFHLLQKRVQAEYAEQGVPAFKREQKVTERTRRIMYAFLDAANEEKQDGEPIK